MLLRVMRIIAVFLVLCLVQGYAYAGDSCPLDADSSPASRSLETSLIEQAIADLRRDQILLFEDPKSFYKQNKFKARETHLKVVTVFLLTGQKALFDLGDTFQVTALSFAAETRIHPNHRDIFDKVQKVFGASRIVNLDLDDGGMRALTGVKAKPYEPIRAFLTFIRFENDISAIHQIGDSLANAKFTHFTTTD